MAANLSAMNRKRRGSTQGGSSLKRAVSQVLMAETKSAPASVATVRRMISRTEELKYLSESPAGVALTTGTPLQLWLNSMIVGANRYQRAGSRCIIKSIDLTIGLESSATAAAPARIRTLVVVDKQVNGALPSSLLPLLGSGLVPIAPGDAWRAPYNPAYVPSRFKVLWDRSDVVGIQGGAANFGERKAAIRKTIKIPKSVAQVQWNDGTAGTIADLNKMGFYLFIYTDYSGGVGTTPTALISYRTNFTDA